MRKSSGIVCWNCLLGACCRRVCRPAPVRQFSRGLAAVNRAARALQRYAVQQWLAGSALVAVLSCGGDTRSAVQEWLAGSALSAVLSCGREDGRCTLYIVTHV
eukprot:315290-Chlamydomonas_euryale.AAC.2